MGRRNLRMDHLGDGVRSQVIPDGQNHLTRNKKKNSFTYSSREGEKREERVRRQVREFLRHAQLDG